MQHRITLEPKLLEISISLFPNIPSHTSGNLHKKGLLKNALASKNLWYMGNEGTHWQH
jgi:hypothetical protein